MVNGPAFSQLTACSFTPKPLRPRENRGSHETPEGGWVGTHLRMRARKSYTDYMMGMEKVYTKDELEAQSNYPCGCPTQSYALDQND